MASKSTEARDIVETGRWPRVIARITAAEPGSTLICIGGLHGNEPAGLQALASVAAAFERKGTIRRGEFLALTGNISASHDRRRYLDRDLNRGWSLSNRANGSEGSIEDLEQRELYQELQAAFLRSRGDVYVVDFHTTSGPGAPFTVFADTLRCRDFARQFPNPLILGIEEHLSGTLVAYVASLGHRAIAFEAGQHNDPEAVTTVRAGIWVAAASAGIIDPDRNHSVAESHRTLRRAAAKLPRVVEVQTRHAILPEDDFRMGSGFASFQPVAQGQLLATDRRGEIRAAHDGFLLMPLYQEQGDDGFFVVKAVSRGWLVVSRALRVLRAGRVVHWLPGIQRDPTEPDILLVDRRVARWVALQVLHLLGFQKLSEKDDILRVRRRPHDLQ